MGVTPKRVPERMCAACRARRPKQELARVVRPPGGGVTIDTTGKANGRGAYLCHDEACLKKARKSRALERALNTAIDEGEYERLAALIAGHAREHGS